MSYRITSLIWIKLCLKKYFSFVRLIKPHSLLPSKGPTKHSMMSKKQITTLVSLKLFINSMVLKDLLRRRRLRMRNSKPWFEGIVRINFGRKQLYFYIMTHCYCRLRELMAKSIWWITSLENPNQKIKMPLYLSLLGLNVSPLL